MNNTNGRESTQTKSSSPQKPMVVSINGGFEIQDEDDYTATQGLTIDNPKPAFVPKPPSDPKPNRGPLKPLRPTPSLNRPNSANNSRQSNSFTSRSFPEKNANQSRPKR